MPETYVIDTFAWIEYFQGTERGRRALEYIEGSGAVTPSIVIAEIVDKYTREKLDARDRLKFVRTKSMIMDLDDETAEAAGAISATRRRQVPGWGLVDSIVLAAARTKGGKVVTGDAHFRGLDETVSI